MIVGILLVALLLGCAQTMMASPCAAYPVGTWKLNQASALEFEQTWLEILNQRNTATLDCMLSPEFADISRKGTLRPKAQVLRELTLHTEQDQFQQNLTELTANLFGDTAVHGVNVISDKQGHVVLRMRFTDVLHFTDRRWLAVAAQETDEAEQ